MQPTAGTGRSADTTGKSEPLLRRQKSPMSALRAVRDDRRVRHPVTCPYCTTEFDLFAASWCEHEEPEASKRCPNCDLCLCAHPAYAEPHFWKDAPEAFHQRGFRRLFLFYL
jgi:hypothetical protein